MTPAPARPVALGYPHDPWDVPPELRGVRQWVAWDWRWLPAARAWTKPPLCPGTGRSASHTDPATWGTFGQAVALAQRRGLAGIGVVLTRELGLVGVDLDKCVARDSGEIAPWAREIVERLDSFTQRSPSGTGLRVFCRATLPAWALAGAGDGRRRGPVEVYQARRYLTVTSMRVPGTPGRIEPRQAAVEAWLAELFPPTGGDEAAPPPPADAVALDDAALLARMFASARGPAIRRLWEGDAADHGGDVSAADLALCDHLAFWTDRDAARIDRLFRASARYRAKWEREDYRRCTIAKALAAVTEGYRGPVLGAAVESRPGGARVQRLALLRRPRRGVPVARYLRPPEAGRP
jgi:primase-polymerase (primpol)-like protein